MQANEPWLGSFTLLLSAHAIAIASAEYEKLRLSTSTFI
jgi:hypothetical protein